MAHSLGTQEHTLSITTIINVQLTGPIYNYVLVTHSNIYKFWAAAAEAWKWVKIQCQVADSMTATWSDFIPSWRDMLLAYKEDESNPNPFEEPDPSKWFLCTSTIGS